MLCTYGRWADPFRVRSKLNTSLEHNVDHIVFASVMRANINASILPRLEHLITAVPLFEKHYTVMWFSIEFSYLVLTELDALMKSAHIGMIFVRSR